MVSSSGSSTPARRRGTAAAYAAVPPISSVEAEPRSAVEVHAPTGGGAARLVGRQDGLAASGAGLVRHVEAVVVRGRLGRVDVGGDRVGRGVLLAVEKSHVVPPRAAAGAGPLTMPDL